MNFCDLRFADPGCGASETWYNGLRSRRACFYTMAYVMPRIMIVEDESDVREFLTRAVHRLLPDAVVDSADNGAVALELFQQHDYHLILTDQRMPVMRGTDLLSSIRASGSDVPIVFITADMIAEEQALQAGASAVFIKPVSLRQLRQILETWIEPT